MFKSLLISKNTSIKDSMILLNKLGSKILIVVTNNNKLLGTVTDGDIRREILKTNNIKKKINGLINFNPIFAYEDSDVNKLKDLSIKNNFNGIPILNKKKNSSRFIFSK